jgi:hypothetical protein
MLLYIIYNADLLEIIDDEQYEDALGYVDNIALVAIGDNFDQTTAKLKNLMEKREGGLDWSRDHNSKFKITKSAVVHSSRKTIRDPENDNQRIQLDRPALIVNGQTISEVSSFKYLGILIDAQLRWNEQAHRAVANATKWLLQYRRLTKPSTGTSAKLMRHLYVSVALPKITYGLDVWYTPPNKKAGQTKNSGSSAALRQLQKTQRIATLAITGALRSSPNDFVDAHAGLLPIDLALRKASYRAVVRLLTLPNTHPLHSILLQIKEHPPTRHECPIASLLRIFRLSGPTVETISPAIQLPVLATKFNIKIQDSREKSIEFKKKDKADFKVYSDGSGLSEGIGVAAALYAKNRHTPISQLKKYLGPNTKHNTFEAETVGAILGTWLLRNCPEAVGKNVSLYIDNQAVMLAANNPKATPRQYLI